MTERRCLFCRYWIMLGDDPNPVAAEWEVQGRHGPNVGLAGQCGHPTRTRYYGAASIATCELWEQRLGERTVEVRTMTPGPSHPDSH